MFPFQLAKYGIGLSFNNILFTNNSPEKKLIYVNRWIAIQRNLIRCQELFSKSKGDTKISNLPLQ